MSNETFGDYIRKARKVLKLPLRKVAAYLDIETFSLSKVERGDWSASSNYLQPLAEFLQLDLKEVQTKFIADRISKDFGGMKHLPAGLKAAEQQIKEKKKKWHQTFLQVRELINAIKNLQVCLSIFKNLANFKSVFG